MLLEYWKSLKSATKILPALAILSLALVGISPVYALAGIQEDPASCERNITSADGTLIVDTIPWDIAEKFLPFDKNFKQLSPVCAFARPESIGNVSLSFEYEPTPYRPRYYGWDGIRRTWTPQETVMNRTTHTVSLTMNSQKAIIAVFADMRDAYEGVASWYRHKRYPQGAATNLYPIGTELRVTNRDTNQSTTVTVTSTWTNTDKRRIIDLVSTAFEKIGKLSMGLIPIRIERL